MCLAIPARIVHIDEDGLATVDFLGVTRSISIDLTPQASKDDFVLVHAGFAIEIVDAEYAQETIDLVKEFPELAGLQPSEVSDRPLEEQSFASVQLSADTQSSADAQLSEGAQHVADGYSRPADVPADYGQLDVQGVDSAATQSDDQHFSQQDSSK